MAEPQDKPAGQTKIMTKKRWFWTLLAMLVVGAGVGVVGVGVTNEMVHWSGTNKFCGSACHSMTWVTQAYERGAHFKTASGVTAGCSDCHIPFHSGSPNPFQYVSMLMYKAKAGARDAYHEAIGTMNTEQKWEAERARLSKNVETWLVDTQFATCRGCHDLEKFGGKANPMVVEMHAGVLKQEKFNCLECHQGVGHVYMDKKAEAPAGHAPAALAAKQP